MRGSPRSEKKDQDRSNEDNEHEKAKRRRVDEPREGGRGRGGDQRLRRVRPDTNPDVQVTVAALGTGLTLPAETEHAAVREFFRKMECERLFFARERRALDAFTGRNNSFRDRGNVPLASAQGRGGHVERDVKIAAGGDCIVVGRRFEDIAESGHSGR